MTYIETVPVDMPDHVTVVPLAAAFAVECRACRVSTWLYHPVVMRDHGAIAAAVEAHRCCPSAGASAPAPARHPAQAAAGEREPGAVGRETT